jgi:DNA-directed RNA polymerase III subunit RPC3
LKRGRQTLGQLVKGIQQTPKQIKESLCILIQHNIVTFAEAIEKGRKLIFYEVNLLNVLLRERFPKYIQYTRKEIGVNVMATNKAAKIVEVLLLFGRLQPQDIQQRSGLTEDATISTMETLLMQKLIMQVTLSDQMTATDRFIHQEQNEVERAGTLLSTTELKKLRARIAAERNAIIADGPTGSKRKLLMTEDEIEKLDALKDPDQYFKSDICYKLNFEQYHIHFRNEDIVNHIRQRIDEIGGEIVRAFLSKVSDRMLVVREKHSAPLAIPTLGLAVASASVELPTIPGSANPLREYVELMTDESEPFLGKDMVTGNQYVIQLEYLSTEMRILNILSILNSKLGVVACRLWRILRQKKKLDDKQVTSPNKGRQVRPGR